MSPDRFRLGALERHVLRVVDDVVDGSYPIRYRQDIEAAVAAVLKADPAFSVKEIAVELVHPNFIRVAGNLKGELEREIVIEGLYDYSPRNHGFRLDVIHMRTSAGDLTENDGLLARILASWKAMSAAGPIRYRGGVFYFSIPPSGARQPAPAGSTDTPCDAVAQVSSQ